jgi:AcrR family transcriptional regulator
MAAPTRDPRARRSRAALEAALRECIGERDLSQISISDVTKRAGVNRSTFYEHYSDVHELAASACTAMFDELVAATPVLRQPVIPGRQPDHRLPELFSHIAEHADLYRVLLGRDGSARVINHLLQRIVVAAHISRDPPETSAPTHAGDPPETAHDPEAAFVAGAVLGTIIDWLRRGCPGTAQQMAAAVLPALVRVATGTAVLSAVTQSGPNRTEGE